MPARAQSKSEAIEAATALVAEGADIDIGLGGINISKLLEFGVSIADAFDPCTNLKLTGTLLDGYYRVALKAGARGTAAERMMLTAYYGGGDREAGELAGFDKQVLRERSKLASEITGLSIGPAPTTGSLIRPVPVNKPVPVNRQPRDDSAARERDAEHPQSGVLPHIW